VLLKCAHMPHIEVRRHDSLESSKDCGFIASRYSDANEIERKKPHFQVAETSPSEDSRVARRVSRVCCESRLTSKEMGTFISSTGVGVHSDDFD
jgi:hypothetical protein